MNTVLCRGKGLRLRIKNTGTSPVLQWLRILLQMQEIWVQFLVKELRSHVPGATKPVCCNYLAHASELETLCTAMKDPALCNAEPMCHN